ncbi:unnamed protein product [Ilex paraguariensis]|uniref:Uncharacterized protein n=1 Tax=Ilex paraguariensis TaxID=185542 RepID=A0ABC8SAP5_9AQUA
MLVDSDYESEYDDMLYDSYVDNEAKWTGLNSNRQKEKTTDKRQQLELSDTDVDSEEILSCFSSSDGENHGRKHKKIQVFRAENDEEDPYFKMEDVVKMGKKRRTCTVTLPEGNQAERSQAGGSQATMNQAGGSQNVVSQGGESQAIGKGSSCFEQVIAAK